MNKELNELKISFNNLVESAVRLNELYEKKCKSELELREENNRLNNIINELKEWFKGYHKSYASCKWYEYDYIEFIEHLEKELKGSDKE